MKMCIDSGDILKIVATNNLYTYFPLYQYVVVVGYTNYQTLDFAVEKEDYIKRCIDKTSLYVFAFYASIEENIEVNVLYNSLIKFFENPLKKMPFTVALNDKKEYTRINMNCKEETNMWLLKSKMVANADFSNSIDEILDLTQYRNLLTSDYTKYYRRLPKSWVNWQETNILKENNVYVFKEKGMLNMYLVIAQNEGSYWMNLLCSVKQKEYKVITFAYALATFLEWGAVDTKYRSLDLNTFNGKIYYVPL